jgi:hypothetical protein
MAKKDYNDIQELMEIASWLNVRRWKLEIQCDGILISNDYHKLCTLFFLEEAVMEKEIPSFDTYLDEMFFEMRTELHLKEYRDEGYSWDEIKELLKREYDEMVEARRKIYDYFS